MTINLPIKIIGTGSYLPETIIESSELEAELNLEPGYYSKRVGVNRRHRVETENCSQLGVKALKQALLDAHLNVSDLNVIVGASATMDYILPNRASSLLAEYPDAQTHNISCVDIDATCISFIAGLHYAALLIQQDPTLHIAVVSAEISKYGIHPSAIEPYGLFGDGASAVIVTGSIENQSGIEHYRIQTYAKGHSHCVIRGGGNAYPSQTTPFSNELFGFAMNGKPLLKLVQDELPHFLSAFANTRFPDNGNKQHPCPMEGVDLLVPHQTSALGFRLLERAIGTCIPPTMNCLAERGNCIAASIPLALDEAIKSGQLKRGQRCMLLGSAAGLSLGALTFIY